MGGGDRETVIQAPPAPQVPTARRSVSEFIESLPDILAAQKEFAPQFAQLQQEIQEQIAPITAGLQETLAGQAQAGIGAELPEALREQFLDVRRSQIGRNVGSPIGAEDISRNMLVQQEMFRQRNQNLALTLAGRQPLASAGGGQQIQQGISAQALPFALGRAGAQAGIFGTQAGLAGQQADINRLVNLGNQQFMGDIIGGGIGAFGQIGAGRF